MSYFWEALAWLLAGFFSLALLVGTVVLILAPVVIYERWKWRRNTSQRSRANSDEPTR